MEGSEVRLGLPLAWPAGLQGRRRSKACLLQEVYDKGLARLEGFQHASGGWGWWQGDATNDFMTAYVLEGLVLCRLAGHGVSDGTIARAERYLSERLFAGELLAGRVGAVGECDINVYVERVLATVYSLDPWRYADQITRLAPVLTGIAEGRTALGVREIAMRADTLRMLGRAEEALDLLRAISLQALQSADRGTIMALATVIEAGVELDANDPAWAACGRRLLSLRRGPSWSDTLTTATAVRGLSALISRSAETSAAIQILVDGRAAARVVPSENRPAALALTTEIESAREVRIRPEREVADLLWSARLEGFVAEAPPEPENPAATLVCRVFELLPERRGLTPDAGGILRVRRGETLEVLMECDTTLPLTCAIVSFPRPCGVELVRPPDLKDGIVALETRDDGLHFFVDSWARGRHTIRFLVRAEAAGLVFAPRPDLQPMYGESISISIRAPALWEVEDVPGVGR